MTNEQREAIELLEGIRDNTWTTKYIMSSDSKKADTVLSLIKEQQEKIAKYEKIYKEYDCYRWVKELDKKDKIIDLMAEFIATLDIEEDVCMKNKTNPDWCNEDYTKCKDCIKQYFERKAKDGRN